MSMDLRTGVNRKDQGTARKIVRVPEPAHEEQALLRRELVRCCASIASVRAVPYPS